MFAVIDATNQNENNKIIILMTNEHQQKVDKICSFLCNVNFFHLKRDLAIRKLFLVCYPLVRNEFDSSS